jgi:hypothetical protein
MMFRRVSLFLERQKTKIIAKTMKPLKILYIAYPKQMIINHHDKIPLNELRPG